MRRSARRGDEPPQKCVDPPDERVALLDERVLRLLEPDFNLEKGVDRVSTPDARPHDLLDPLRKRDEAAHRPLFSPFGDVDPVRRLVLRVRRGGEAPLIDAHRLRGVGSTRLRRGDRLHHLGGRLDDATIHLATSAIGSGSSLIGSVTTLRPVRNSFPTWPNEFPGACVTRANGRITTPGGQTRNPEAAVMVPRPIVSTPEGIDATSGSRVATPGSRVASRSSRVATPGS